MEIAWKGVSPLFSFVELKVEIVTAIITPSEIQVTVPAIEKPPTKPCATVAFVKVSKIAELSLVIEAEEMSLPEDVETTETVVDGKMI